LKSERVREEREREREREERERGERESEREDSADTVGEGRKGYGLGFKGLEFNV
jgi:hypothetical protein